MKTTLSVVIVTFRSNDIIIDCLRSIKLFNDIGAYLEVVIVDNSEREIFNELKVIVNKEWGDFVNIVWSGGNYGYGAANNIGINHAKSDIILIMNPDARLSQKCFNTVLAKFSKNSFLSLYGCKEYDEDLKIKNSFFYKMEYHSIFRVMFLNKILNYLNLFDSAKMYLNGAFFFVRKSHFLDAGGFDEKIFLYAEEPDLSQRLSNLNPFGVIEYDHSIGYIHLKKISANSVATLTHAVDSAVYYISKYGFDVNKYVKSRWRYSVFKRFLSFIMGRKEDVQIYKYISEYLKTKYLKQQ